MVCAREMIDSKVSSGSRKILPPMEKKLGYKQRNITKGKSERLGID